QEPFSGIVLKQRHPLQPGPAPSIWNLGMVFLRGLPTFVFLNGHGNDSMPGGRADNLSTNFQYACQSPADEGDSGVR
ncbi:MAG TPA: hypothetical protein VEE85_00035, partial [Candidatus Bathyarchaeia archaeon]|nr:hypothetical protein [Candidatus Bathyarchaeia archaeon]